jgi:hypothetical protein
LSSLLLIFILSISKMNVIFHAFRLKKDYVEKILNDILLYKAA